MNNDSNTGEHFVRVTYLVGGLIEHVANIVAMFYVFVQLCVSNFSATMISLDLFYVVYNSICPFENLSNDAISFQQAFSI